MTSPREPDTVGRGIHTDAFEIAPSVAALTLAGRRRRVWALLLDLSLIGCLNLVFKFPALPLAVLVSFLLYRSGLTWLPKGMTPSQRELLRVGVASLGAALLLLVGYQLHKGEAEENARHQEERALEKKRGIEEAEKVLAAIDKSGGLEATKGLASVTKAGLQIAKEELDSEDDEEPADEARAGPQSPALREAQARIRHLEKERATLRTELKASEEKLKAAEHSTGMLHGLEQFAEDLGIEVSWAALYFLFFNVVWNGQTPGKRLLRIRVVRLNGKPLGVVGAFERFHGTVSCLLGGLLGFLQVLWEHNYQGHHDKIAETVVVNEPRPIPKAELVP
jgi:hypothetical protein